MEVVMFSLICISIFFGYLANSNNNENLKLKNSFREREFEVQYLLDEKEREISNLKRQFQAEKNKLLQVPNKNRSEIFELQKKLRESENETINLKNRLEKIQNENEMLKKNISKLESELTEKNKSNSVDNEIFILRNKNYEQQNIITALKNENDELRTKIKNLERNQQREITLFDENSFTPTTKTLRTSKKFVQVIFPGYSHDRYDYLLGNHRNIKVGDFVMVGTKKGARRAKVVYISEAGEISSRAKSEIIKKVK